MHRKFLTVRIRKRTERTTRVHHFVTLAVKNPPAKSPVKAYTFAVGTANFWRRKKPLKTDIREVDLISMLIFLGKRELPREPNAESCNSVWINYSYGPTR